MSLASRTTDARLCIAPVSTEGGRQPVSLIRTQQTRELYFCWHMVWCLLLQWRARLEPIATFELVFDIGGGILTKSERAELLQELRREVTEPEPLETTAMLEAAGRWFCRIRIPGTVDDLLRGQPLRLRAEEASSK